MRPKGIRTAMTGKKKNDKSTVQPTSSNRENMTPVGIKSQTSVTGKLTESRKRALEEESPSTSDQSPSTSEPPRKAVKKIELIIKPSPTEEAEDEEELDFGKGGYYPVKDGQVLNKRYEVQKILGHGSFATVHMAEDRMTKSTVAVKITKSEKRYKKFSELEIEFMEKIKEVSCSDSSSTSDPPTGSKNIVTLLDDFRIKVRQEIHVVMVLEVLGMDLFNLLCESNQRVLNLNRIKSFSRNILEGLHFLHTKCNIIHLDIKPENCLVTVDPDNMDLSDPNCKASLKIGDFGTSAYTTDNITGKVQTCHYRAPEGFLEAEITPLVDIWSFGCILYEMATRDLLFPCSKEVGKCDYKRHFCDISELLGSIKMSFFKKNERNATIFDKVFGKEKAIVKKPAETNSISPEELRKHCLLTISEADELCTFMREVLIINPNQRLSAKEALKHPFFTEDCSE